MTSRPDFRSQLPSWFEAFDRLDPVSQRAWDERVRRLGVGSATPEDREVQERAREALSSGRPLPAAARRMPGPELAPNERTWWPDARDDPGRMVSCGIPVLIAEQLAVGDVRETRSTRACDRHGLDGRMTLVLCGDVGCGKSFAAARWLWSASHGASPLIRRRVLARRFLEAPMLGEVPFERRAEIGDCLALVVDEAGGEREHLRGPVVELLVARYRNRLPTVVTTNLSQRDLCQLYGARFEDRMREVGRWVVVSTSASESMRGGSR
jgi:hypothetical protein